MARNENTFKVADVSTPEIEGKEKCVELTIFMMSANL